MVRIGIAGGVIPQVLKITAVGLLAVVAFCTRRRFRSIGVALGVAAAIAVAVAVLVPTVPRTFALWVSASVFALSLAAVGWRGFCCTRS